MRVDANTTNMASLQKVFEEGWSEHSITFPDTWYHLDSMSDESDDGSGNSDSGCGGDGCVSGVGSTGSGVGGDGGGSCVAAAMPVSGVV